MKLILVTLHLVVPMLCAIMEYVHVDLNIEVIHTEVVDQNVYLTMNVQEIKLALDPNVLTLVLALVQ